MRALLPVLLALLLICNGCVWATPPQRAHIFYGIPLEAEDWWEDLYHQMERCTGRGGNYRALRFFIVQPGGMGRSEEGEHVGLWSSRHRIYIDSRFVLNAHVLKHEFGHDLWQLGDAVHADPLFQACVSI